MRIAARSFDTDLPRETEVVIIGGGIVGTCAAWYLAQRGIPVLVCEKGYVGAEQSTRALGWVRVTSRDPRDIADEDRGIHACLNRDGFKVFDVARN